jgi:hypothetical protein
MFQAKVSVLVTGCIVKGLEIINVNQDDSDPALVFDGNIAQDGQRGIHVSAVEDSGERVQARQPLQMRVHAQNVFYVQAVGFVQQEFPPVGPFATVPFIKSRQAEADAEDKEIACDRGAKMARPTNFA